MHDLSNITTIFHCTGIFFNTRDIGDEGLQYSYPKHLFHCTGIIFNTRDMLGCLIR